MLHAICPATGVIEVVDVPPPEIGPGEALIALDACGICGTDISKVYSASVAKPVQLGHEIVGGIVAVGAGVERLEVGQSVAVAHHVPDFASHYTRRNSAPQDALFKRSNIDPGGFAELIRAPALHVQHTVLPLPGGMPPLRGVFMEPLACCLRALDRVSVTEGDTVLLVGAGAAGLLFVPPLCDRSAAVHAADVRPERLEAARRWGAEAGYRVGAEDIPAAVRRASEGRGADLIILTVLSAATLGLALEAVRDGGTVLLFGVKPDTLIGADFWQIWRREINLVSSYSATPDLFPRALAILRRPALSLEETISHLVPLKEAARGFQLVHDGQASKVVITRE